MKSKVMVVVFSTMLVMGVSALLSACAAPVTPSSAPTSPNTENAPPETTPVLKQSPATDDVVQPDLIRTDLQGIVEVAVRPVSLSGSSQTLEFEISMNTHSVDLSMDLATLATLTTDTSKTVTPVTWDAPRGGHHVYGMLSFPAQIDGIGLLDGAKRLTLTIRDVDVPERVFVWELGS